MANFNEQALEISIMYNCPLSELKTGKDSFKYGDRL